MFTAIVAIDQSKPRPSYYVAEPMPADGTAPPLPTPIEVGAR